MLQSCPKYRLAAFPGTPRSDGLYTGTCVFETSELYVDAKDASALQAREPSTFLEQSNESDDDEDPFYVPGVADESRERRMRRQPIQPSNPSLPECMDLPSFKHKYTDEETEETVFHGQCDTPRRRATTRHLKPTSTSSIRLVSSTCWRNCRRSSTQSCTCFIHESPGFDGRRM